MKTLFDIKVILLLIFCTLILIIKETESAACSKDVKLPHATVVSCSNKSGKEFVKFKCDSGYEFERNVFEKEMDINHDNIKSGIGCNSI